MSSFTMTTHQIWSCHVTLATGFENVSFSANSILNFRKSCQIWGKVAQEQKSYRQKTKLGVENTPPSAYRVNYHLFLPRRMLHAEVMDHELSFAHKISLPTLKPRKRRRQKAILTLSA